MCFCDSGLPVRLLSVLLVGMALCAADCPAQCTCREVEIQCDNQHLKHLPKRIPFQARSLDVSRNRIQLLPPTELRFLPDLVFLNCSYNLLATVSRLVFLNLVKLVYLDLSHNRLTAITRTSFQTLRSLTLLWLNHNRLATIEEFSFSEAEGLQELDISDNDIAFLNITSLKELEGLKTLRLANNPWTCDCNLYDLGDWMNDQNETFPDSQSAVCSLPEQYTGTFILQTLKLMSHVCQNPLDYENYIYFIIVSSCIFISSIVLVGLSGVSRIYYKRYIVSMESNYDIEERQKVKGSRSIGTLTN